MNAKEVMIDVLRFYTDSEEAIAEKLLAALSAANLEIGPGWRPIEESDKYAGMYELFCPDRIDPDFNPEGIVEGFWQDGVGWMGAVWCNDHDEWHTLKVNPTHFAPKHSTYQVALERIDYLMGVSTGDPKRDVLDALVTLVENYEDERFPIDKPFALPEQSE